MVFTRLAAACSALLLVSGCSHLLQAPAQYAALPVSSSSPATVGSGAERPDAALPLVVIPGQLLAAPGRRRGSTVEPHAALQQSARARLAWKELRPTDLLKPPLIESMRAALADEPGATASLPSSGRGGAANPAAPATQDREKSMSHLLDQGGAPAKTICDRC